MQQLGPSSLTARQEVEKKLRLFEESLLGFPENIPQITSMASAYK